MKRFAQALSLAAITTLAGAATAQIATSTDEAREQASREQAQQRKFSIFAKPQLESVEPGDYFAQARNQTREANYHAMVAAVFAYGDGSRSQPIAVLSEDSARAEAARVRAEQDIASRHALLQTSAQARRDVEDGMQATARVATR